MTARYRIGLIGLLISGVALIIGTTAAEQNRFAFLTESSRASVLSERTKITTALQSASVEFDVPLSILQAVAFVQSRWTAQVPSGREEGTPAWGPMGLADGRIHQHLTDAALLIHREPDDVRYDSSTNIRAAAALLAEYYDQSEGTNGRRNKPATWERSLEVFSGFESDKLAKSWVRDVFAVIRTGYHREGINIASDPTILSERSLPKSSVSVSLAPPGQLGYPNALWCGDDNPSNCPPACSPGVSYDPNRNLIGGSGTAAIKKIIVHTTGLSAIATAQSALNRFLDCSQQVSAHYIIRQAGDVWQVIGDQDGAFHAGNFDYNEESIGIELEGAADGPGGDFSWQTPAQNASLVNLVQWLVGQYPGLKADRAHIIGHNQVPGREPACSSALWGGCGQHWDPGAWWNWRSFMSDVVGHGPTFAELQITAANSCPVFTIPGKDEFGNAAPQFTSAWHGQKFVAYDSYFNSIENQKYYLIFVSGEEEPVLENNLQYHWDGWISSSCVSSAPVDDQLEVLNVFPSQLNIRSGPSTSSPVEGQTIDGKRYAATGNVQTDSNGFEFHEYDLAWDSGARTGWSAKNCNNPGPGCLTESGASQTPTATHTPTPTSTLIPHTPTQTATATNTPTATVTATPTPAHTPVALTLDDIFVTNFGSVVGLPSVLKYSAGSGGNTVPTENISGLGTMLDAPAAIFVDSQSNLFVANSGGQSINEFIAAATGEMAPVLHIAGVNTTIDFPQGVAVDSQGRIYTSSLSPDSILIFSPDKTGNVSPVAGIAGSNTLLNEPAGITLDMADNIYVCESSGQIAVFSGGKFGNVPPTRVIAGNLTKLQNPAGIAVDNNGEIYVADIQANSILHFSSVANGNMPPSSTIAGPATDLNHPHGVALGGSGAVYVTNSDDSIFEFAAGATGNIPPAVTISGPNTSLNQPIGVAVRSTKTIVTATVTPSATASKAATPTLTPTVTQSATLTATPTRSATVTPTPSQTPTATPTSSITRTATPTQTATSTATNTATQSKTPTATATVTLTATATSTATPTVTSTRTQTVTATPTLTVTPSTTATSSPTSTATPICATDGASCSFGDLPCCSNTSVCSAGLGGFVCVPFLTPTATATTTPTATPTPDGGKLIVPSSLNLKAVGIGTGKISSSNLKIQNGGKGGNLFGSIALSSSGKAISAQIVGPFSIAPKHPLTDNIRCVPDALQNSAMVIITSNDAANPTVNLPITCQGLGGQLLVPKRVTISGRLGSPATAKFIIKNVGKGVLSGDVETASSPYIVTTGSGPFGPLQPNGTKTVQVDFTPTSKGKAAQGSLTIVVDPLSTGSTTVTLNGIGK